MKLSKISKRFPQTTLFGLAPTGLLLLLLLALPVPARADSVTLTSGTTSVQVPPGQISIALNGGGSFSLNYFNPDYAGPLTSSFGFQSITQGSGSLTFGAVTTQFFSGSLSFDSNFLAGQVTAFQTLNDALNNNPAFTVTFSGGGFFVSGPTNQTFTVATPEPASLTLLGLGVAAFAAKLRRRQTK